MEHTLIKKRVAVNSTGTEILNFSSKAQQKESREDRTNKYIRSLSQNLPQHIRLSLELEDDNTTQVQNSTEFYFNVSISFSLQECQPQYILKNVWEKDNFSRQSTDMTIGLYINSTLKTQYAILINNSECPIFLYASFYFPSNIPPLKTILHLLYFDFVSYMSQDEISQISKGSSTDISLVLSTAGQPYYIYPKYHFFLSLLSFISFDYIYIWISTN